MNILFYLGHPAHFHLFKNVIEILKTNNHQITIVIKSKDVLQDLLKESGYDFTNIYPGERKKDKISIALSLGRRNFELIKIVRKNKIGLMAGTSAEITHIGKILNIPSIVFNEDDFDAIPYFAKAAYPLASSIIAPSFCRVGKWEKKTVFYSGYHELAYLHPKLFKPDLLIGEKLKGDRDRYFILRFAKLTAHHDKGKTGLTNELAKKIISILEPHGNVYVTSEREILPELEKYLIKINPSDMHHALFYAEIYIGDSQTMAAEAAVLGTPSIRFNDFVGKLGYLEELERKYGLTYGIKTTEPEKLFDKISELISFKNLKDEWQKRREKMLSEKIDVTLFFQWFIENYPESLKVMKQNPDYQYNFK